MSFKRWSQAPGGRHLKRKTGEIIDAETNNEK
jgi:hypothetical protein